MKVTANGKTFTFPDGTSKEQISEAVDYYFKASQSQPVISDDIPIDIPNTPEKQPASFGEKIIGAGESALTAATAATTGTLGQLVGSVTGAAGESLGLLEKGQGDNPLTMKPSEGQQMASDFASALTYKPRTEAGQEIVGEAAELLEGIPPYLGLGATANVSSVVGNLKKPLKGSAKDVLAAVSPSNDQLRKAAAQLYSEIESANVKIPRNDYQNFAMTLNNRLRSRGLDDALTPKASAVLKRVSNDLEGGRTGLNDIEKVRRLANTATQDFNNPTDQALGSVIKDTIDDFVQNEASKFSGDTDIGQLYRGARNLTQRRKKSEAVDEAVYRASQAASGFENGLRNEFRSLLKNKKRRGGFTSEEKALMNQITQGGTLENTLKKLGKLGVGADQQTNMLLGFLGSSAGAGAGAAVAGAPGAVIGGLALPTIGQLSASTAKRLANKNQSFLSDLTRAGKDGGRIVDAYLKNVPKRDQSKAELSSLLLDPTVDMSTVKDIAAKYKSQKRFVDDAIFIADRLKNAQLAAYAAQLSANQDSVSDNQQEGQDEQQ